MNSGRTLAAVVDPRMGGGRIGLFARIANFIGRVGSNLRLAVFSRAGWQFGYPNFVQRR